MWSVNINILNLKNHEIWHEKFPNNNIPVLADEYDDLRQWMKPTGYPCVNILDENMKLITSTGRGINPAFDILSDLK